MASDVTVYTSNDAFFARFADLGRGDLFVGRLRLRRNEELLAVDLLHRGVRFYPSLLSQLLSRSKALQGRLLGSWMVPGTTVITDLHDLHRLIGGPATPEPGEAQGWITKLDRKDAGMGVHKWPDLEAVLNAATFGALPLPFLVQPFIANATDTRVIILGDYLEAYERANRGNFRANLHFGGSSRPVTATAPMLAICRAVMQRGGFPYAHIDLLTSPQGEIFLSEISLRGGLRGARITPQEYQQRLAALHATAAAHHQRPAGSRP